MTSETAQLVSEIADLRLKSFRHGLFIGLAIGLFFGYFVFSCSTASAADYSLKLNETDFVWQKIVNDHDPLMPQIDSQNWGDHVAIEPYLSFLNKGFFNSSWYFDSAYGKPTEVGLRFDAGVHVFDWSDIVWSHQSIHSADQSNTYNDPNKFQLHDYVGIRLKFKP